MKMKKIIYLALSVIFLTFSSCSSDSSSNSSAATVVGKWKVTNYSIPENYEPCDYLGWIDIKSNGNYDEYEQCFDETSSGTWVKNGQTLTVTSSQLSIPIAFTIVSLTQTTMVLRFSLFETEEVTYTKI
jgi:hypothetical protein